MQYPNIAIIVFRAGAIFHGYLARTEISIADPAYCRVAGSGSHGLEKQSFQNTNSIYAVIETCNASSG